MSHAAIRPRSIRGPLLSFLAVVVAPLALAAAYYYAVAADRYVTEFRYSVRGGATLQQGEGGVGGILGSGAALVYASDSFVLEDYLTSREAFVDVEAELPLRDFLGRDGGDPVRGYDRDAPLEDLLDYWRAAVDPRFDAITGITTVTVSLFTPADSEKVALVLVEELRRIVDSLSAEARQEMLAYVNAEFTRAAAELSRALEAIEAFRRANKLITPSEQVNIGADIIGALSSQLAQTRVELRTLREQTPNAPRVAVLQREIASIEAQLAEEVSRRGGQDSAMLPSQLANFEELQNRYQIARDNYVSTLQLKQAAEANAALGQAELVVFVPPRPPEASTEPSKATQLLKVFVAALLIWIIARILFAILRTQ